MKRKELYVLAAFAAISLGIIGCGNTVDNNKDDPSIEISESVDDQSTGAVSTIGKKEEIPSSGADKETTEAEKQTTTENQTTATTEDSNKTTSGTTTERQTVTTTEAATQTTTQTSTTSRTEPTTQVTTQAVTDATTTTQATTEARQKEETTQATTEARQTEATTQATTEARQTEATTAHQHNWVAIYKTVHHDREEIWGTCYQDIYETHTLCNNRDCLYDFTAHGEHGGSCPNGCGAGWHGESVKVGTEELYEIIDIKPAYDEQVFDHYECTCGATKN